MLATVNTRSATTADIPFLARIEYEASLPPLQHCFWEDLLQQTGTTALQFIDAKLRAIASNWGNVSDFVIVEDQGQPVAAAAGYVPNPDNYTPLQVERLDAIAQILHWSPDTTATFRRQYLEFCGGDLRPVFLAPQASWIVESVAVLPEARGRGMGKALLRAVLEKGRSLQHPYAGIMVINGNDAARHTYESLGFKPYQTFYPEYFLDQVQMEFPQMEFPGITKFRLQLN